MQLTNVLCAKVKTKYVLVLAKSMVSKHQKYLVRERVADKLELIKWDPFVREYVVYQEIKKLHGVDFRYHKT